MLLDIKSILLLIFVSINEVFEPQYVLFLQLNYSYRKFRGFSVTTPATTQAPAQTPAPAQPAPVTTGGYTSNLSAEEAAAKEEIARRESGGSYTAQNGQYYGRYQLTITYLNGDLSPENQERVADAYVYGRYGSWVAALAHSNAKGWY